MTEDTPAIREVAASGVPFRVVRTERPSSAEESAVLQGIDADLDPTHLIRLLDADVANVTRPAS